MTAVYLGFAIAALALLMVALATGEARAWQAMRIVLIIAIGVGLIAYALDLAG